MKRSISLGKAAAAAAGLSALFVIVYGGCNWIAAHRANVGSLYFEWEKKIPFVPLLIPAYLSLDLFFIGAPFLCRTHQELRTFARRITAAILIAGLCFLLCPFRFAFPRPAVGGALGGLFDWFRRIDAPYNLIPSLHAALLLLVGEVYVRHLRGKIRVAAIGWFVLIGLSPILTYQHHLVDIVAGFGLAAYAFYFFPERAHNWPVQKNYRIGFYYTAGASTLVALGLIFGGWMLLLLWPAVALGIVGCSYFGAGPGVYRKTNGRLPWSSSVVLAPCLLGQRLSLSYYRRQCRPWDAVTPQVWIGSKLNSARANEALRAGVTSVLDLTAECSEAERFLDAHYLNVPVLDLTAPTQQQLLDIAQFIETQTSAGIVYVHCKIGYSRSAAAVAAYLIVSGKGNTAAEALRMIKGVRPSVVIRPEIAAVLNRFELDHKPVRVGPESFVLASDARALA